MKKFIMTGIYNYLGNISLYQIQAVKSFNNVKKGDLGGWIEKEENLDHGGDAWIYDDAKVYGNAQIFGNARVASNAQVFGNAQVRDDAFVSGDVLICGDARIYGNAIIYGKAKVHGNARVYGNGAIFSSARVSGNAQVYGKAHVYGNASVAGNSVVRDKADIRGNARVFGNANICGSASIIGDARVYGNAFVRNITVDTSVSDGIHTNGDVIIETSEGNLSPVGAKDSECWKECLVLLKSIDSKLKNKLEPTGPTEGQQIKTIQCTKGSGNITIHITIS